MLQLPKSFPVWDCGSFYHVPVVLDTREGSSLPLSHCSLSHIELIHEDQREEKKMVGPFSAKINDFTCFDPIFEIITLLLVDFHLLYFIHPSIFKSI